MTALKSIRAQSESSGLKQLSVRALGTFTPSKSRNASVIKHFASVILG